MNKKVPLGVSIAIVILAIALTISATMFLSMRYFSSLVSDVGKRQAMYDYIDEIDSLARRYYTIDEEKLRAALADGYAGGLEDPYAAYLTAEEYKEIQNRKAGNRTGFGLTITVSKDNQLVISSVDENSPAAVSGICRGDILTGIDNETMDGASYEAVMSKLNDSSKRLLSISHEGLSSAVELMPNTYKLVSVESRMLDETVGYLAISDFNDLTPLQFKNAYNALTQSGATAFVFDVRNTDGISIDAVKDILSYLIPRGPYAVCETKSGKETFTAEDNYEMTAQCVVLVNGDTVGEAEFFAGVLQDLSKASLVGTSTQGKSVQQIYAAIDSDKAAVCLTVGELHRINSGAAWSDTGLIPDLSVDMPYEKALYFDLLTDAEDPQLQQALAILKDNSILLLSETPAIQP